jgi:hypothetical protein
MTVFAPRVIRIASKKGFEERPAIPAFRRRCYLYRVGERARQKSVGCSGWES